PWTNWNVYQDSTGNGQTPVTGLTPLCPDTFWLIVDTTGMGAANIVGYRWELKNIFSANVVFPSAHVGYFPMDGIPNVRKLGVHFVSGGLGGAVLLKVYFSSGDSTGIFKSLPLRPAPSIVFNSPSSGQIICPGSSVSFSLNVIGADSFKVGYGPNPGDTVRNQLTFTATAPSSGSSWQIQVTAYYCSSQIVSFYSFNLNPSLAFLGIQVGPGFSFCPGDIVTISLSPFSNITGSTSLSLNVTGPGGFSQTATSLPYSFTLPSTALAGSYNASLSVSYPCGSATATAAFTVNGPGSLSSPIGISPNPSPFCAGIPVFLNVMGGQGLVSWDIGNDGTWDYVGTTSIQHVFSTVPPGGIPIKIKQDIGCDSREDVFTWDTSGVASPTGFGSALPYNACPGQNVRFIVYANSFVPNAPGCTLQWQAPWLNSGNPFNGYSLDTILPAPTVPGPATLQYTLQNSCGTYTGSIAFNVGSVNVFAPSPSILGAVCSGGGTLQLVTPSVSGMINADYIGPNGTVLFNDALPGDTVSVAVPSTGITVTIEYNFGCAKAYAPVNLRPSNDPALINFVNVSPTITCPGGQVGIFVSGRNGQYLKVYHGSTLLGQTTVTSSGFSNAFSANLDVPAPAGNTNLMIVVTGCGGNDTAYYTISAQSTGAVAAFNAPQSACVGQPVTFQRTGTNANVYGVNWDFGDNTSILYDTSLSVTHIYTQPGTYTVYLTVNSSCGYTFANKTIKVYSNPPTLSGLSVTPSGSQITYSVTAVDADSVKWFFNYPNTTPSALGTSGTHTYGSAGTYTVAAVAYNACGTDTLTQTINIITTSVAGLSKAGEWILYPNPTRHEAFLVNSNYTGPVQVRLYDVHGRFIGMYLVQSLPARIELNGVPAGLYQVQIVSERGIETLRLAVE
ncbi:MAG: PKD domain-containing protein, partial [Bacteroidia bacterium]